jgi:curved DNA-binding protein CbpA
MSKYREITEARTLLELPESATLEEVKSHYRMLLTRWHPDRSGGRNREQCNDMTRRIIAAYRTLVAYCAEYRFSFAEQEVKKYLSPEEWWFERFNDPLHGGTAKSGNPRQSPHRGGMK